MSSHIKDNESVGRKIGMAFTYVILILFAVLAIAPILWLVMSSFKTSQSYQLDRLGFPHEFFWQNYRDAWIRGHLSLIHI